MDVMDGRRTPGEPGEGNPSARDLRSNQGPPRSDPAEMTYGQARRSKGTMGNVPTAFAGTVSPQLAREATEPDTGTMPDRPRSWRAEPPTTCRDTESHRPGNHPVAKPLTSTMTEHEQQTVKPPDRRAASGKQTATAAAAVGFRGPEQCSQ